MTSFCESILIPHKLPGVTIPKHLTIHCAGLFEHDARKGGTLGISITRVTPIPLEELVLLASSRSAYLVAQRDPQHLKTQLAKTKAILRLGANLSLTLSSANRSVYPSDNVVEHKYTYKAVLTTPVHQGYVDPEKTQILVAAGDFDPGDLVGSPTSTNVETSESDDEESDIDESFLLKSLAEPSSVRGSHQEPMGAANSTLFRVLPLETRHVASMTESRDLTILIRTADLARLGIFSGDWVSCFCLLARVLLI